MQRQRLVNFVAFIFSKASEAGGLLFEVDFLSVADPVGISYECV